MSYDEVLPALPWSPIFERGPCISSRDLTPKLLLLSSIFHARAAKMAAAFIRQGCAVEAVCPPDHPFRFMQGFRKIYKYRGVRSISSLAAAIRAANPDFLLPCDDGVVWQLYQLHASIPALRPLIERSLGSARSFPILQDRARTLATAAELGVRVPAPGNPTALGASFKAHSSWVLKLDGTQAGSGVRIVHSLAEANEALAQLTQPPSASLALGRWFLLNDPIALWERKHRSHAALSMQRYIPGRPANALVVCRDGTVKDIAIVEVLSSAGPTGAALAVRSIANHEIRAAAVAIAASLNLSGFFGLDFVLEQGTGHAFLIEINPRCTQIAHLPVATSGDLVAAFCSAFQLTRKAPEPHIALTQPIHFFPATKSNAVNDERTFLDVPWDQPKLVKELLRRDWCHRRPLARLYYRLRPPVETSPATSLLEPASSPALPDCLSEKQVVTHQRYPPPRVKTQESPKARTPVLQ